MQLPGTANLVTAVGMKEERFSKHPSPILLLRSELFPKLLFATVKIYKYTSPHIVSSSQGKYLLGRGNFNHKICSREELNTTSHMSKFSVHSVCIPFKDIFDVGIPFNFGS